MKTDTTKRRLPWENRTPIYEYVQTHLNIKGIVDYVDWDLPDDVPLKNDAESYEPGVDDWLESSSDKEVDPVFINCLCDFFEYYSKTGQEKYKVALYKILKEDHVIGYWRDFVDELGQRQIPIFPYLQKLIRWMVCKAPDRGVVKMGIILLGLMKEPDDVKFLKIIAKHEEFVNYVGEALMQMTPMWDLILIELIEPLSSWGRLLSVELLAYNSERKEVKAWIVRYGHRKFYITSFLSLTCAECGDLRGQLLKEKWDKELIQATQVVIIELLKSVNSCYSYEFGGDVIRLYLKHELGKRKSVMQYYILSELQSFFKKVANDETLLLKFGLREEDYSDIWIDVNKELKKTWCEKLRERYLITGSENYYFSRAYIRNCN